MQLTLLEEERHLAKFFADHQCQDAVIRRIEVLGEAANRISDTVQSHYSHIPWREMRTMRNRVIHGYDTIDLAVVWQTVQLSIPEIVKPLEIVLNDLNNDESCQ